MLHMSCHLQTMLHQPARHAQVIEQTESFEEPPAKDMWEGDNFEVGATL